MCVWVAGICLGNETNVYGEIASKKMILTIKHTIYFYNTIIVPYLLFFAFTLYISCDLARELPDGCNVVFERKQV